MKMAEIGIKEIRNHEITDFINDEGLKLESQIKHSWPSGLRRQTQVLVS
jgi:hypothetical protein